MEKLAQYTKVAVKIYKALKIEKGEFAYKAMIANGFTVLKSIPYTGPKIPKPHTHYSILKLDLK